MTIKMMIRKFFKKIDIVTIAPSSCASQSNQELFYSVVIDIKAGSIVSGQLK